jgi:hypothetical protein
MATKQTAETLGNLDLWKSVERTPLEHTKPIEGKAYTGNSPSPYYLVQKATETFGPIGIGWGFSIINERVEDGAGNERLHIALVRVWYKWNGERGEVEHIGGTPLCGTRRNGSFYTDEDAPKKSVTDALVKALSLIGFAGDIFIGRYDDSKYMNELRDEQKQQQQAKALSARAQRLLNIAKMSKTQREITAWVGANREAIDALPPAESTIVLQTARDIYLDLPDKLPDDSQDEAGEAQDGDDDRYRDDVP